MGNSFQESVFGEHQRAYINESFDVNMRQHIANASQELSTLFLPSLAPNFHGYCARDVRDEAVRYACLVHKSLPTHLVLG